MIYGNEVIGTICKKLNSYISLLEASADIHDLSIICIDYFFWSMTRSLFYASQTTETYIMKHLSLWIKLLQDEFATSDIVRDFVKNRFSYIDLSANWGGPSSISAKSDYDLSISVDRYSLQPNLYCPVTFNMKSYHWASAPQFIGLAVESWLYRKIWT